MTRYRRCLNFFSNFYLDEAEAKIQGLFEQGHISIFEHETLLNAINFIRLAEKRDRVFRRIRYSIIAFSIGSLVAHIFFQ